MPENNDRLLRLEKALTALRVDQEEARLIDSSIDRLGLGINDALLAFASLSHELEEVKAEHIETARSLRQSMREFTDQVEANRRRAWARTYQVFGVLAVLVVLAVIAVPGLLLRPFDPLDNSRLQVVTNELPGYDMPAVVLGGEVTVKGTKCNRTDELVSLRGKIQWINVAPGGFTFQVSDGPYVRPPGCTTKTFVNAMPAEVTRRSEKLLDSGVTEVRWQIVGVERPNTGRDPVASTWLTSEFRIVSKGGTT